MKTYSELGHFGGLDWAKHHHDVCVLDPGGQIVERLRFEHSGPGWEKFRQQIQKYPALGIAIETSQGAVVEQLLGSGVTVYPVHPKAAKEYRKRQAPQRTVIIGRIRKDAVLYELPQVQPTLGRKRKYGPWLATPEALLRDDQVPFQTVRAFAAGKVHDFQIKRLGPVVMRLDRAARPVQILIIKALGYRLKNGGKLLYRAPAFLVCTDPQMALEDFLQDFLWRWDIEVNFRDEKTLLGVGQAQVRTEASNQNAPALAVAAYALLLMASVRAYGKSGVPDRLLEAKWYRRKEQQRATTAELINQLRRELWSEALNPNHFPDFTTQGDPDQKSEKCEVPLASAAFLSSN